MATFQDTWRKFYDEYLQKAMERNQQQNSPMNQASQVYQNYQQPQYFDPYISQLPQNVSQYSRDYQAEINKRSPSDSLIPLLQMGRLQKLVQNPGMIEKYGQSFMPPATMQRLEDRKRQMAQEDMSNRMNQLQYDTESYKLNQMKDPNSYENQYNKLSLDKVRADIAASKALASQRNDKATSMDRIGMLYTSMVQSGDPEAWLAQNSSFLTGDELDKLINYTTKNIGRQLSPDQKRAIANDLTETINNVLVSNKETAETGSLFDTVTTMIQGETMLDDAEKQKIWERILATNPDLKAEYEVRKKQELDKYNAALSGQNKDLRGSLPLGQYPLVTPIPYNRGTPKPDPNLFPGAYRTPRPTPGRR